MYTQRTSGIFRKPDYPVRIWSPLGSMRHQYRGRAGNRNLFEGFPVWRSETLYICGKSPLLLIIISLVPEVSM